MTLLKGRVFNLALLLAMAVMMPSVVNAQMTEIKLAGGGSGTGGAQGMTVGGVGVVEGDLGGTAETSTTGPEAVAFDGTNVWVATQFNDSVTKVRAADGFVLGTYKVGKRPVALLYASGSIW